MIVAPVARRLRCSAICRTRHDPDKRALMSQIEKLAKVYERHVGVPWQRTMAGAQRVMLAV